MPWQLHPLPLPLLLAPVIQTPSRCLAPNPQLLSFCLYVYDSIADGDGLKCFFLAWTRSPASRVPGVVVGSRSACGDRAPQDGVLGLRVPCLFLAVAGVADRSGRTFVGFCSWASTGALQSGTNLGYSMSYVPRRLPHLCPGNLHLPRSMMGVQT